MGVPPHCVRVRDAYNTRVIRTLHVPAVQLQQLPTHASRVSLTLWFTLLLFRMLRKIFQVVLKNIPDMIHFRGSGSNWKVDMTFRQIECEV